MYIVGTAGHVDHGKSSLVRALTGVDPDRLPEEKERNLTIELGFASYINAAGQTVGVIDVPGHQRFIRNMAGGVWSLDCALLVVAADDGWMEQTEDHAAILKAMDVPAILLVITKADAVDTARLEEVKEEAAEHFFILFERETPIVVTSATTGDGLQMLKEEIDRQLTKRHAHRYGPAFYIDRSFTIEGAGAVATGSLRQMNLAVGDVVTLLPSQTEAKVRALQSFGQTVQEAGDGTRIALSLASISHSQLNRGALVTTEPDFYTLAKRVYLIIRPVYNGEELKLKRRGEVEISGGTWHDWATVKVIGPLPASIAIAEATLSSERPWHFGQTVVLIRSGSSRPLAQATVLTAAALTPEQFGRLSDLVHTHNALPAEIADEEYLKLFLEGWGLITTTQKKSLSLLGQQYNRFGSWYLEASRLNTLKTLLLDRVTERGLYSLETFKAENPYPHRLTHLVVESMIAQEVVSLTGGNLQTTDTQGTTMGAEEEQLLKKIEASGFSGHLVKHITKAEKRFLGPLLQKKLIIIVDSTYIYSTAVFEEIIERIIDGRAVGSTFSIAEAKDGLPLSRKYMLPLLNKIEELGFVEREGDRRRVVQPAGKL